jgi:hypothetical protein
MRWLEEPRPKRVLRPRTQSIALPWYVGQKRVKSLVGTDVRVKRIA